jgi:hypothetical protein
MKTSQNMIEDLARKDGDPSTGWASLGLSIAKVLEIHAAELKCTLQIIHGEGDLSYPLSGVEILLPSIGSRHFMGAIPEIGDKCVVGWFVGDSKGPANGKTPAILAWWPQATYLGHDWLPTQSFKPGEGFDSNKRRQEIESHYSRVRNKLRHYQPGNVGASSSQGSDLVLDESVLLSNRRSNEILLRDQDQAIVLRSLQQFHAMSGARVYAGMVQRDARSLPKEMFSDGIKWDSSIQLDTQGRPLYPLDDEYEVREETPGLLSPHPLFVRNNPTINEDGDITGSRTFEGEVEPPMDPYRFLYDAGLVGEEFFDETLEGLTYGGKSIFRLGTEGDNATDTGNAFTEYRIEVTHTTDGTLPVTEQTDGFDADKLPNERGGDSNTPFIEWVLGTPVGNDPFSNQGKPLYGLPLVPQEQEIVAADDETRVEDHAATLLKVSPVLSNVRDAFASWTKGGKFKAHVSSPASDAVRVSALGGVQLSSEAELTLGADSINLFTTNESYISSNTITLKAEGSREGGPLEGDGREASIFINGTKRVALQSGTSLSFKAPIVDFSEAGEIRLNSNSLLDLSTGSGLNLAGDRVKVTSTGSYDEVIAGPPSFNALHGPVKKVTIAANPVTGHPGGPSDSYTNAYGGREEIYLTATTNTKTIATGTETTTIGVGQSTNTVGTNVATHSMDGFKFIAPTGTVNMVGGALISMSSAVIQTSARTATRIASPSISLLSPGVASGAIVCGSDIDPILGVPFSTFCPPRGQNLGAAVFA